MKKKRSISHQIDKRYYYILRGLCKQCSQCIMGGRDHMISLKRIKSLCHHFVHFEKRDFDPKLSNHLPYQTSNLRMQAPSLTHPTPNTRKMIPKISLLRTRQAQVRKKKKNRISFRLLRKNTTTQLGVHRVTHIVSRRIRKKNTYKMSTQGKV